MGEGEGEGMGGCAGGTGNHAGSGPPARRYVGVVYFLSSLECGLSRLAGEITSHRKVGVLRMEYGMTVLCHPGAAVAAGAWHPL